MSNKGDQYYSELKAHIEKLEDESFLQERLSILQKNFGKDFVDLGVINADGKQTAYAGPFKLAKADYADAGWFRRSIQSEFFISDVFLGLRGMPHFIIAVRNSHQEGHWILRATIDFVRFTNLVENIRLGETGFAFILNKTGELQTTPISRPSIEVDARSTTSTLKGIVDCSSLSRSRLSLRLIAPPVSTATSKSEVAVNAPVALEPNK